VITIYAFFLFKSVIPCKVQYYIVYFNGALKNCYVCLFVNHYKDLSRLVTQQQEDIDKVELHMEQSNMHAKQGLAQLEKANLNADRQCVIS
jgi:hypothetical protein